MPNRRDAFCRRTRRELLWQTGAGFGSAALASMLSADGFLDNQAVGADGKTEFINPLSPRQPHHQPKAKSVIFLFMYGGPSHIDTFDYKPQMIGMDGKTITVKTFGRGGKRNRGRVVEPRWKFQQYGECGKWVSSLFPNVAKHVDDISFVHSMTADSPIHGSAMFMMNSGKVLSGSPSLGSWATYGLGTVNQNLPGYVVMLDKTGGPINGAKNWSSGYMPASYQGTHFKTEGAPVLDLVPPAHMRGGIQREVINSIQRANKRHASTRTGSADLDARIASYELAYGMQTTASEAVELDKETEHTVKLYGIDDPATQNFGKRCLLARRLVERGVRFIQVYSGGAHNDDNWDAHGDLEKNHNHHAGATDKPIAGLLKDLKDRGMLDETLVIWGGEFGRQPTAEYTKGSGRDHNSYGFTMWMAGGGIKGGVSVGTTDEIGSAAVDKPFHVKNLHATVLHQLGLDPNKLSYFYSGLNQKLVGVEHVKPIAECIA